MPPTPATPNPYGHIVRWHEERGDNTRTRFRWDIFVLAGDPHTTRRSTLNEEDIFGSPDGLWFDDDGRLWIETDISNSSQNRADRGYDHIGNNQMLVADTQTGEIRRFLTGPARLRDHRHHRHTRPAHALRQRAAPGRSHQLLGHSDAGEPTGRQQLAGLRPGRSPAIGHRRHPQERRRTHRHLSDADAANRMHPCSRVRGGDDRERVDHRQLSRPDDDGVGVPDRSDLSSVTVGGWVRRTNSR